MRRVVVTGMGIVSSIGNNTQEVTNSLYEAKSGIVRADKYAELGFRCQVHGAPTLEPGDYWARVQATRSGESLGLPAMARFIINARDIELDNPTADPDLMREIAEITGGVAVAPEDFGTFIDKLLEAGINTEMLRHRRINLWDHWLLLTLFVLLMSTEWTIRKLKGLV